MRLADARAMAKGLMAQHLDGQKPGWVFMFDNGKRRFGCCHYRDKKITLSRQLTLLNDEATVRNTMLHEIAHALAPARAGHDKQWRKIAHSIGCDGQTYYDSSVVQRPEPKFMGKCPNCDRIIKRHRRGNIACGQCCKRYNGGMYSKEYAIIWAE